MEDPQATSAEQNVNNNTAQQFPERGSAEAARIVELEAQLAQARQEAGENWNRYLRERADWDNFRKRQERLVTDRVQQQKKSVFKRLLEIMDNIDLALQHQESMDKVQFQQMLRMLHRQMSDVLSSEGLSSVPTVGEVFNPYLHEAIEVIENSDQPEGTILEEMRKGYTLGEETLRPARVKVSK